MNTQKNQWLYDLDDFDLSPDELKHIKDSFLKHLDMKSDLPRTGKPIIIDPDHLDNSWMFPRKHNKL